MIYGAEVSSAVLTHEQYKWDFSRSKIQGVLNDDFQ